MKGVVNGFEVRTFTKDDQKGIFVVYKIDERPLTYSKHYPIDEEDIKRVKEKLEDCTKTNNEADKLCQTIPLLSMIYFVKKIIVD